MAGKCVVLKTNKAFHVVGLALIVGLEEIFEVLVGEADELLGF